MVLVDDLDQSDDLVARDPLGELRMVAPEMLQREVDELILGLAADDLAALACDLPGHGIGSGAIVGSGPFAYVGAKVGAKLERAENTYVQLCGRFVVELRGSRVEQRFPSRQGRILFAYLVLHRPRAVGRGELIEAIWAGEEPGDHASALTVLLSKLRAAVGADVLAGRGSVRVALPAGARVDVEQALAARHRAESAVVQGDWTRAWSAALGARYVTERPLLPGYDDLPWLDVWRRRLDEALDSALEAYATACLGLGGTEIAGAERAARRLLEHNPLRETGYGLLMQALAARGNVAEALHVYERARTLLRDELGIPPGPAIHDIHAALLGAPKTTPSQRSTKGS
jgi:SARP family transcriptional regulator, regulator of embCAB operon